MRKYRKQEHVENYLKSNYLGDPLFKNVYLEHNSLPGISFDDIDTSVDFLGRKIDFPLMINAVTGGSDFSETINRDLANLAKEFKLPMAVGSETVAIEDPSARDSFKIVREILEDGIVLGNINGLSCEKDAQTAIDIINADALQIHLNPAQEIAMEEGDRCFKSVLGNIETIVKSLSVPVIVKEVGFGLSKSNVKKLYDVGVRNVDIAGFGGTNFFEVENLRYPEEDFSELFGWGIPTALSLLEVNDLKYEDLFVIGSGGIRNSGDLVKAIVLGSDMTAICGELLNYLLRGGYEYAREYLFQLIKKTKMIMLLLGVTSIPELKKQPYRLTGELRNLYRQSAK